MNEIPIDDNDFLDEYLLVERWKWVKALQLIREVRGESFILDALGIPHTQVGDTKRLCEKCLGSFIPKNNRHKYCLQCSKVVQRERAAAYYRRKKGIV